MRATVSAAFAKLPILNRTEVDDVSLSPDFPNGVWLRVWPFAFGAGSGRTGGRAGIDWGTDGRADADVRWSDGRTDGGNEEEPSQRTDERTSNAVLSAATAAKKHNHTGSRPPLSLSLSLPWLAAAITASAAATAPHATELGRSFGYSMMMVPSLSCP